MRALARTYRGVLLVLVDREPEALPELAGARALAEETGAVDLVALCDNYLGLARLYLGQPGGVDVADGQLGATAGEVVGQRAADPRTRPGDDGDCVPDGGHVRTPR